MLNFMTPFQPLNTLGHIAGAGAAALTGMGLFVPILTLITASAGLLGSGGSTLDETAMGQDDRGHTDRPMINNGNNTIYVNLTFGSGTAGSKIKARARKRK